MVFLRFGDLFGGHELEHESHGGDNFPFSVRWEEFGDFPCLGGGLDYHESTLIEYLL